MDDSLCRWLASVNIHELDVELLLPAFSSERISTLDDLVDVVGDAELQQIVLDVLQAQPISRVAAKRIERALKALSLTLVLPAAANAVAVRPQPRLAYPFCATRRRRHHHHTSTSHLFQTAPRPVPRATSPSSHQLQHHCPRLQ